MNTTSASSRRAGIAVSYQIVGRVMLAALAGLLLAACSSPTPATSLPAGPTSQPAPADTSAPAAPQQAISKDIVLDPANAENTDSVLVNGYLYEGLVKLEGGKPVPSLAASWIISKDGLAYTLKLQPGVVFHDGTPLTADAVNANFSRWFDPADPLHGSATYDSWKEVFLGFRGEVDSAGAPVSPFDGIEKADDLTVLIHLNREMPDLLEKLSEPAFALVSPTALADGKFAGTGPYAISQQTDQLITLQPNTSYWGAVPDKGLEFVLK